MTDEIPEELPSEVEDQLQIMAAERGCDREFEYIGCSECSSYNECVIKSYDLAQIKIREQVRDEKEEMETLLNRVEDFKGGTIGLSARDELLETFQSLRNRVRELEEKEGLVPDAIKLMQEREDELLGKIAHLEAKRSSKLAELVEALEQGKRLYTIMLDNPEYKRYIYFESFGQSSRREFIATGFGTRPEQGAWSDPEDIAKWFLEKPDEWKIEERPDNGCEKEESPKEKRTL